MAQLEGGMPSSGSSPSETVSGKYVGKGRFLLIDLHTYCMDGSTTAVVYHRNRYELLTVIGSGSLAEAMFNQTAPLSRMN